MRDVTFYDLNFNRLYILPQGSENKGYVSCNAQKQFNDIGSIEIVYSDPELSDIIKQNRENLMMEWNGLWWLFAAYRDEGITYRITGDSLNALLRRSVIPATAINSGNVARYAQYVIEYYVPWLSIGDLKEFKNEISYPTDTYKTADEYLIGLLELDNAGFDIKADIVKKRFIFELLESREKRLLLSSNNLNAYDFSETYINRSIAYGGWYAEESEGETTWQYVTVDESLEGVFKRDVVLTSATRTEALQELKLKSADAEIEFKTKGIVYGRDYELGDILRVQNGGTAVRRRVVGVIMSQENGYIENPIFSEVE